MRTRTWAEMCGAGLGSQMDQQDTGLLMFTPLKLSGGEGSESSNPFLKASSGGWGRGNGSVGKVTALKGEDLTQSPATTCKTGYRGACLYPNTGEWDRKISGTYWPARLAELVSSRQMRDPASKQDR